MAADYVLELPNDVRAIERAVDYLMERCRDAGFDCDRVSLNLRVGVSEALTNAMLYGNRSDPQKRVRLEAHLTPRAAVIEITDQGRGFDPENIPDPTLPRNRRRTGGRGLFLIRQLMDRVEFNERGNSIRMILYSHTPKPRKAGGGGA